MKWDREVREAERALAKARGEIEASPRGVPGSRRPGGRVKRRRSWDSYTRSK